VERRVQRIGEVAMELGGDPHLLKQEEMCTLFTWAVQREKRVYEDSSPIKLYKM
jgi:hypothetical protein